MVWGRGPTAEYLFASSEPNDPTKSIGFHKAIDAEAWRVSYTFDEDGTGDEITVPNDESFPAGIEGEISKAAFSSDDIYLAMGRNDNHTHVYDSRYLGRLLFDYEHHGPPRTNPGGDSYGVVKVQWVDEDSVLPFGLITGGNDGCVRFWGRRVAFAVGDDGNVVQVLERSLCDDEDRVGFKCGGKMRGA
ncbi:hypothetical protein DXG01_004645 [Tephrocybe rancida]|nr:hypothetical protein DXG01_004645 [Tephrocybe rancida]